MSSTKEERPTLPKSSWVKIIQIRTLAAERFGRKIAEASPEVLVNSVWDFFRHHHLISCAHLIRDEMMPRCGSTAIPIRKTGFSNKSLATRSDKKRACQTASPFFDIEISSALFAAGLVTSSSLPAPRDRPSYSAGLTHSGHGCA